MLSKAVAEAFTDAMKTFVQIVNITIDLSYTDISIINGKRIEERCVPCFISISLMKSQMFL